MTVIAGRCVPRALRVGGIVVGHDAHGERSHLIVERQNRYGEGEIGMAMSVGRCPQCAPARTATAPSVCTTYDPAYDPAALSVPDALGALENMQIARRSD
ncbi:hypothetical protein [Streptomyces gilvosporeus]|uniref:hypothetical protein n=1 Tax=Streptomyces gilvosporeus TaxID=553510 RepID=UPI00131AA1D2|nr:hypothetical protein [Streptomyces gilvosporeus]